MADETTWSKRIAEWRESGLTAREYCAGRDFAVTALYWWSSKLRGDANAARTAPIRVARVVRQASAIAEVDEDGETDPPVVLVEVGDARVFVTAGVASATLSMVLEVLDARAQGARR